MFRIRFSEEASNVYNNTDDATARKINRCIERLCQNPFYGSNIRKLKGELKGSYRYRMGSIRVIYSIDKREKVIWVEYIRTRGKAYRA
jgi:mRNA interferase RelE/StbE